MIPLLYDNTYVNIDMDAILANFDIGTNLEEGNQYGAVENTSFGMKLFGFSTLLNTVLNYLLIFGKCGCPAMGVTGAALATLLSRVAECIICVICALRDKTVPLDMAAFLRPGGEMARRFLRYASPVILSETVWGIGNSMYTVIMGYTHNSVEMLAANAVIGNLS